MSVRVNLLPGEVRARGQANRARLGAIIAGLFLLLVLGGLTVLQRGSIGEAEDRLAAVEDANEQLRADITALQPFADLEARGSSSVEVVELALGDEGSMATILQDLSAVLPPNAQLDTMAVTFPGEVSAPAAGGTRLVYGTLTATGRVLDGVAPGVERLILDLDRVAAFDNAYMTTSTIDEDGVATFTLEVQLGPEVLSGRYALDIPPAAPAPVDQEASS